VGGVRGREREPIHPHFEKGEKQQDVPEKYTRVKGNGSIAFSSARRDGKRERKLGERIVRRRMGYVRTLMCVIGVFFFS